MYRDTYATVNLDALKSNIENLIAFGNKEYVYAVVKANGYGHGALEVAEVAIEAGATHLAVAFLDEAIELRQKFPKLPILVLGYTDPKDFETAAKYAITLTVTNMEQIDKLVHYRGKLLKLHFKSNTGMNRIGFATVEELKEAYVKLRYNADLNIEGLFTHFATADSEDIAYFNKQAKKFKSIVDDIGSFFKIIHCQNSAATLFPIEEFAYCNAIRLGIAMYGSNPSTEQAALVNLKPVMSVYSHVTSVMTLKKGEKVGYGASYVMEKKGVVATIPIGYADGIIRANSGRHVIINDERFKIIGRVCMDQLMILVDESVKLGDRVELFGTKLNISEVSKYLSTIDYEVLCSISDRVVRCYIEDNEITSVKYFRYQNL